MTTTEEDIHFPNTTWRRCQSKGEGEGSCMKTKICRDRGPGGTEVERKKKEAKTSKGQRLMRRKLVVAVGK